MRSRSVSSADGPLNHEEQYSIWLVGRELPLGWNTVGVCGSKEECLAHIEKVWTDMRPRSLREQMAAAKSDDPSLENDSNARTPAENIGATLLERLAKEQPVCLVLRPEATAAALSEALSRNFVHVKFVETKGGTELGVRLEAEDSSRLRSEVEGGTSSIGIAGRLVLDGHPVRCVASIELESLSGSGRLEPAESLASGGEA